MTGYIETKDDDGVWTVTLKRADKANALTADMLDALADIAQAAQSAQGIDPDGGRQGVQRRCRS